MIACFTKDWRTRNSTVALALAWCTRLTAFTLCVGRRPLVQIASWSSAMLEATQAHELHQRLVMVWLRERLGICLEDAPKGSHSPEAPGD